MTEGPWQSDYIAALHAAEHSRQCERVGRLLPDVRDVIAMAEGWLADREILLASNPDDPDSAELVQRIVSSEAGLAGAMMEFLEQRDKRK